MCMRMGGRRMMEAAREALEGVASRPKLIAVTVLTSMGQEDLNELGIPGEPQETVLRLARLAQASGLDGVVCSAQEATLLRQELGTDFCLVTPGIRPANASQDDQSADRHAGGGNPPRLGLSGDRPANYQGGRSPAGSTANQS